MNPPVREELRARPHDAAQPGAEDTFPSFEQTFERLRENLEAFDPAKVRLDEIARASVFAAPRLARTAARRRASPRVARRPGHWQAR